MTDRPELIDAWRGPTASQAQGLTLAAARRMISAVEEVAGRLQVAMSVAVVDSGDQLVAFARMDGADLVGVRLAQDKAYTALVNRMPTGDLPPLVQPGAEFYGYHTVNAGRDNVVEQVRALTGGRGVDYAFDAIGGEATTLQIVDAIRPGGTAVIVGMAAMAVRAPVTPYLMALQEKTLKGTLYGSIKPLVDMPRLVDLYMDGKLKIDQLVSRTYELDEINEGFRRMLSGEVARGVIVFN